MEQTETEPLAGEKKLNSEEHQLAWSMLPLEIQELLLLQTLKQCDATPEPLGAFKSYARMRLINSTIREIVGGRIILDQLITQLKDQLRNTPHFKLAFIRACGSGAFNIVSGFIKNVEKSSDSNDLEVLLNARITVAFYQWEELNAYTVSYKDPYVRKLDFFQRHILHPLLQAAAHGHKNIVELLISKGTDVNTKIFGLTALQVAAVYGHKKVVKYLLRNGAQIDTEGRGDFTNVCYSRSWIAEMIERDHKDILHLLLRKGLVINERSDDILDSILKAGNVLLLKKSLNQGIDLNGALLQAAKYGQRKVVELLLDSGAHVNYREKTKYGNSDKNALSHAAIEGHTEVGELLIAYGAEVNTINYCGETPLTFACEKGHFDFVKLLVNNGVEINTVQHYLEKSPLFLAVENRHEEIIEFLIAHGAEVNIYDKNGDTPLIIAAKANNTEIVRLLLSKTAASVNWKGRWGITPLHEAAARGNIEMVRLLLDHRASIDAYNEWGSTPLDSAKSFDHEEVIRLMEEVNRQDWCTLI